MFTLYREDNDMILLRTKLRFSALTILRGGSEADFEVIINTVRLLEPADE